MPQFNSTQLAMHLKDILSSRLRLSFLLGLTLTFCSAVSAEAARLLNGPMLTHTTMHSVQVWVQTDRPASVFVEYWPVETPEERFRSASVQTGPAHGHIAKLQAEAGIEPGRTYRYQIARETDSGEPLVLTGGRTLHFQSKPRWRWVPDPVSQLPHSIFDFRIAMGSCAYINQPGTDREGGRPYGDQYQIFESIAAKSPDLMLWLGDNVYYRENDFEDRAGMIRRWTHDRQIPELADLFANTIHYATWDDHDYGPNNIGRSYWLKADATEVFQLMWGNPSAGLPETPGIFTYVNWGDANIYFLDNRTYQSPSESEPGELGPPKELLGRAQVDWLIDHLAWTKSQSLDDRKSYPARFNLIVIGSQVLSASGNPDGMRNFPEEYEYLMNRLTAEGHRNIIFLSGDVHFGEVNRVEHSFGEKRQIFHEVTSSPLTAGSWAGSTVNDARLDIFPGEMDRVGQRNFVTLDFTGPLDDRRMEIRYWDSDGNLLNQKPGAPAGTPTDASILRAGEP